jgi:pyruvate dehydrogenase E2 component (dihydrolipoamide acetyltransferase)
LREIVMPKSSMTMAEGELVKWLVTDGDEVKEGEPIAIILTDKVEMEIEAPHDGRLAIVAEEGTTVPVGHTIAHILAPGEPRPSPPSPSAGTPPSPPAEPGTPVTTNAPEGATQQNSDRKLRASPAARAMAKRLGIDLARVKGSGPRGRIRSGDVAAHARPSPRAASVGRQQTAQAETERYRPSGIQGMMARRMQAAASIPQFTLFADISLVAVERARTLAKQQGLGTFTLTDVLARALALTLKQHTILNSHFVNGEVVTHPQVDLGIAVDTPQGLVVPVIAAADRLGLPELAHRRRELTEAARLGRLRPDEVGGATFTLTNLGMYGITAFQPVVDPPQVAILAVGSMRADASRSATFAVGADHRVVDGAQAARFLAALRDLIEYPVELFGPAPS